MGHPQKAFTGILALLFTIFLQFLLFSQPSNASAVLPNSVAVAARSDNATIDTRNLIKRYAGTPAGKVEDPPGGPDESDYPSDDGIRAAFTNPPGPYVFFSQIGDSTPGYEFVQTKGGVIIRGAYPKKYTNQNGRSNQWRQDWGDRVSGVFAEKASGDVYFVSNWATNGEVEDCRVWSRIEYPTLKANGNVKRVILVDYENFNNQKVIWTPEGVIGQRDEDTALLERSVLAERNTVKACYDWDGYGDDPADPDHGAAPAPFAPGWCSVHFVQYQKNEGTGDTSKYRYDITLFDNNGEIVGSKDTVAIADHATANIDSALPYAMLVVSGAIDSDPVGFKYSNQSWDTDKSGNHDCRVGGYDSGKRQGDCGFSC